MIYIGADHAGFKLKEKIKKFLDKRSISYADLGAHEFNKDDDYVDFAEKVAKKVAQKKSGRGILVCAGGNGMAIAANKIKGVRAGLAWSRKSVRSAVQDDHANIIALGSKRVNRFNANRIVRAFLSAKPSTAERHVRRVKKISELEK